MSWTLFQRAFAWVVMMAACACGIARPLNAQFRIAWDGSAGASEFKAFALTAVTRAGDSLDARWLDEQSLGTTVRYDGRFVQLGGNALLRTGGVATHGSGAMRAMIAPPAWHGFRLSVGTDAQYWPLDVSVTRARDSTSLQLSAPVSRLQPAWSSNEYGRLAYARGMNGVWLSVSLRQGALVSDSVAMRYLTGGYSRQYKDLIFGIGIGTQLARVPSGVSRFSATRYQVQYTDSSGVRRDSTATGIKGDSGVAGGIRRLSDIAARLTWARGRFSVDAVVNARPHVAGLQSSVWGEANAVAALGSRVAIVTGMHATQMLPGMTSSPSKSVNLGLRVAPTALLRTSNAAPVAPAAHDFEVRAVSPGVYILSLRLTAASVVEIAGDFTDWKPLPLHQTDAARWEITLVVAAGSHRCNVRVDGAEWIAPAGMTSVHDEFNGRVGIFVVD